MREPWNAPIHNTLKAIDNHTQEYFKSGDKWHLEKADQLRQYINELKTWIHKKEKDEEVNSTSSDSDTSANE